MRSFFLLFTFFSWTAFGDCASPTGVAGQLQWIASSSKVMWCDGATWKDSSVSTSGGCSGITAGTINYSAGVLRFCNGTNWISMTGTSAGSCAGIEAGTITYMAGEMRVCNGTNWLEIGASSGTWSATPVNQSCSGSAFPGASACATNLPSGSCSPVGSQCVVVAASPMCPIGASPGPTYRLYACQ